LSEVCLCEPVESTQRSRRTKQETGAARKKTSTYVDQASGTASDAVASVQVTYNRIYEANKKLIDFNPQETASQATSQTKRATDNFQSQAAAQANTAAKEGKKDVEAMKTTGAGYVEQAKGLAENALSTAQVKSPYFVQRSR
jgi:hypothetical protein